MAFGRHTTRTLGIRISTMQPHGKSLLVGLAGTVQGRLGWAGDEIGKLVPRLEEIISNSAWLNAADFDTIHYVMRFGATAEDRIYCRRRPEYQELEVASQVQMSQLHEVFLNREKLRALLCNELLRMFEHLTRKYKLEPLPELTEMLSSYIIAQQSAPGDAPQAARP